MYSAVNWYAADEESNSPHMIMDKMNVTTVVSSATRLTREISEGVVSLIGAKIKAPSRGRRIKVVSIVV